jgi:hypothetical protein
MYGHLGLFHFYGDAEISQTAQCRVAIRACRIICDVARPFRQRGQNGVAMRDGFVARKRNGASQLRRRFYYFLHLFDNVRAAIPDVQFHASARLRPD